MKFTPVDQYQINKITTEEREETSPSSEFKKYNYLLIFSSPRKSRDQKSVKDVVSKNNQSERVKFESCLINALG